MTLVVMHRPTARSHRRSGHSQTSRSFRDGGLYIDRSATGAVIMAWDKEFPHLVDFAKRGKDLYGGDDVICLWPTWPTLGLDPRNQFDMYRDLPGGLKGLKSMADSLRAIGVKFFIAYNPWDTGTSIVNLSIYTSFN